jgi:tRNA(Arg) A34 adenosine deaminase TadA
MLTWLGSGLVVLVLPRASCASLGETERFFVAEAERMRQEAVSAGDHPYGAIIVRNGAIIGYGPSRVLTDRNTDAHAERVAIRDALSRLGTSDLSGTVMYSTSRPCSLCENAAAEARIERMYYGPDATDAGPPRLR